MIRRLAAVAGVAAALASALWGCVTTPDAPPIDPAQLAAARAEFKRGVAAAEKDPKGAEAAFEKALLLDPGLHEAAYDLGVLAERRGDLAAAEKRYAAVSKAKPSLRQATQNLAALKARRGDVKGAAELFRDFTGGDVKDARQLAQLALLHRAAGETDAALDAARRALRAEPSRVEALAAAALALADAGRPDLADLVLARVPPDRSKGAPVLLARGAVAIRRGRFEEALQHLRASAEADPAYPAPRLYAAQLLLQAGDVDGAVAELKTVLARNPGHAGAHLTLGVALRMKKDFAGAEAAYRKALQNDPELVEAAYDLAVLYMDFLEKPAAAKPHLERFLQSETRPPSRDADARARLGKL